MLTPTIALIATLQITLGSDTTATQSVPGLGPTRVIHVPGDVATIQGAIDLATPGDGVLVAPGTWAESLTLKNGVRLTSSHGAASTVLEGTGGLSIASGHGLSRDTLIRGFTFRPGAAGSATGLEFMVAEPTVTDCVFHGAFGPGIFPLSAAVSSTWYSSVLMERCVFDGADVPNAHGAAWTFYVGAITFRNCLFTNYVAPSVVTISDGNVALINCTLAENNAVGIDLGNGYALVQNSIVRNETPFEFVMANGRADVLFSNVRGFAPLDGNIDADPWFIDAAMGSFGLLSGSPGIDAGNNQLMTAPTVNLFPTGPSTRDLKGNARIADDPQTPDVGVGAPDVIDMGAFEWTP